MAKGEYCFSVCLFCKKPVPDLFFFCASSCSSSFLLQRCFSCPLLFFLLLFTLFTLFTLSFLDRRQPPLGDSCPRRRARRASRSRFPAFPPRRSLLPTLLLFLLLLSFSHSRRRLSLDLSLPNPDVPPPLRLGFPLLLPRRASPSPNGSPAPVLSDSNRGLPPWLGRARRHVRSFSPALLPPFFGLSLRRLPDPSRRVQRGLFPPRHSPLPHHRSDFLLLLLPPPPPLLPSPPCRRQIRHARARFPHSSRQVRHHLPLPSPPHDLDLLPL